MLLPMMNILTMWVLQCHIPNNLPTHPHKIQISKIKYAYVSGVYLKEPYASIAFQNNINYPSALNTYIYIYPLVRIRIW
jgi:hypothetical protein